MLIKYEFNIDDEWRISSSVGISHEAVLLQETAKPALFRATTNILSSDQ
jgi:hypothetical protein